MQMLPHREDILVDTSLYCSTPADLRSLMALSRHRSCALADEQLALRWPDVYCVRKALAAAIRSSNPAYRTRPRSPAGTWGSHPANGSTDGGTGISFILSWRGWQL